jgi:mevalonate kinase
VTTYSACGKWILAGEHSVLRGAEALVFPFVGGKIQLAFQDGTEPLSLQFTGNKGQELELLSWGVIERALSRVGQNLSTVRGVLRIESNLPIGAGLGASAALCVVIGRWCMGQGWLTQNELYEFSRNLENMFHGESSGVDIAVAIANRGLAFTRHQRPLPLELKWQPKLYLSYCGQRGVTSECVSKVKQLIDRNPVLGEEIDRKMIEASRLGKLALIESDEADGFAVLIESIHLAKHCFEQWGLTNGAMGQHLQALSEAGAVAVKPTGSGGGGYALSLWAKEPPAMFGLVPAL